MNVALDPWQLIRGIAFPAGEVTVENIGQVLVSGPGSPTLPLCIGGSQFISGYYRIQSWSFNALSARFYDCDQLHITITGRTSGTVLEIGGGPDKVEEGLSYPSCMTNTCFFSHDEIWARLYTTGAWDTLDFLAYTPYAGFIHLEPIDITFPAAPKLPITQIIDRGGSTVWVDCVDHRGIVGAWCNLSGTGLYDGLHEVTLIDSVDRFAITTPYVGDATGGTVQANFLQ